ncbi:MAG: hypothetical protein HY558_06055 [Euryarchaeota archaeon]|nr:hypothetical protein [Euryarchaeota archaeon]
MAEQNVVSLDPQGRIVIPRRIRRAVAARRFEIGVHDDRIELRPIRPLEELFGSLPRLDTGRILREHRREVEDEE